MVNCHDDVCDCRMIHPERIEKAQKGALKTETVTQLAQLFKAISDPGRVKILLALEHGEMCVCDLAALLKVSESATSHQLRLLRQLQLVANRREGAILYYRLNKNIANQLLALGLKHLEGE